VPGWEIRRVQLAVVVPTDAAETWAEIRPKAPLSVPKAERKAAEEAGTTRMWCRIDRGRWVPTSEADLVGGLAADGWELVSVVADPTPAHWLYFKRPQG